MINKEYWDKFYSKENKAPLMESDFAHYVNKYIADNSLEGRLLDIACGNGRDSRFLSRSGIDVTGIDLSIDMDTKMFSFERADMFDYDFNDFNFFYLRFVVHSLTSDEFDVLIDKLESLDGDRYIFIETRSSKGVTDESSSETNYKSAIGDKHFRMLYSKDFLDEKLGDHFDIIKSEESNEFAIYGESKPYCMRYILRKK